MPAVSPAVSRFGLDRAVRRLVVWCLLFVLPVYGFSSTLVGLLGVNHFHARPAPSASPMDGWHDFRRAVLVAGTAPHGHAHGVFQRHHHDLADESVVSLDAEGGGRVAGDASPSSGAAVIAVLLAATFSEGQPRPWAAARWPDAATQAIERIEAGRLERPPRA